jgi:uncharacterized integral membrane protein (TIGR00697 family)
MKILLPGILAMAVIVVASNILVQHPMGAFLTWGALTYPFSFLVNDITNRLQGVRAARIVVLAGFVVGLICSVIGTQIHNDFGPLVTLRIAMGSGTAFLVGQLLDVTLFDRLRRAEWWRAPLISTLMGSTLDSVIFFTLAFSASLTFLEPGNDVSWAATPGPLLGIGPVVPFWVALFGLLPFRLIVAKMSVRVA